MGSSGGWALRGQEWSWRGCGRRSQCWVGRGVLIEAARCGRGEECGEEESLVCYFY